VRIRRGAAVHAPPRAVIVLLVLAIAPARDTPLVTPCFACLRRLHVMVFRNNDACEMANRKMVSGEWQGW
jgi:hypothetical protein